MNRSTQQEGLLIRGFGAIKVYPFHCRFVANKKKLTREKHLNVFTIWGMSISLSVCLSTTGTLRKEETDIPS